MAHVLGLFSYNGIEGVPVGWQQKEGHKVFAVHNGRSGRNREAQLDADLLERLWQQLEPVLDQLDQLIVYLGSQGCLELIQWLKAVPPEKLMFVTCGCLLLEKKAILQSNGLAVCPHLACECGGGRTMARLCWNFLDQGHVEGAPAPMLVRMGT